MIHNLLQTIRERCEQNKISLTPVLLIASVADQRLIVLHKKIEWSFSEDVSYTHLRAHETDS